MTGVQYAIDKSNGACSIDPIPSSATGYDAVYNVSTDTLNIRDPMQFFNIKGGDLIVWVGQRPVRGLQANVFQKFTDQIPGRGGVIYEVYFIKVSSTQSFVQNELPVYKAIYEVNFIIVYEQHSGELAVDVWVSECTGCHRRG